MLCCWALDCARGALRSSSLGRWTGRPRRPYTAPPPPPPPLLLLPSQCCEIEMIHELSCCRAGSSSRAARARARVVISQRRIVRGTKWEQSVTCRRPVAHRRPSGTIQRHSSASYHSYTSRASMPQRLPCCVDMVQQQQVVRARHGRCSVTISQR